MNAPPDDRPSFGGLGAGRLGAAVAYAAVVTWIICGPVWPGLMSFDSLLAYRQSIDGVETAVWPPMHDYMFWVSRTLTGGPGGLLAGQTFLLFLGAGMILGMLVRVPWRLALGLAAFAASFLYFPTLVGTAIVLWKDVPLASFGLIAIALWMLAHRRRSRTLLILAAVAFGIGISVRHNGLPLLLPLAALMVVRPVSDPRWRDRGIAAGALAVALAFAFASTIWRLPDLQRLPPPGPAFAAVQLWDLVGVSACEDENLLPASFNDQQRVSDASFDSLFDPRHVNLTSKALEDAMPGLPALTDTHVEVEGTWRSALLDHTGCYIDARNAVFAEQMGLNDAVFYPTHGGIDENPYGLVLRDPAAASVRIESVVSGADQWARRPFWLYALTTAALAFVAIRRRHGWTSPLCFALGLGAFAYVVSLYFLAPAADARYIFPSNVFCALAVVIALTASRTTTRPASEPTERAVAPEPVPDDYEPPAPLVAGRT